MKRLFLPLLTALTLASCQTADEKARLAYIGDVALDLAEKSGRITPEQASLAREAGKLILSEPGETVVLEGLEPSK